MSRPAKRPAKAAIKKPAARKISVAKAAKPKSNDWKTLNDRGSDLTMEGDLEGAIAELEAMETRLLRATRGCSEEGIEES